MYHEEPCESPARVNYCLTIVQEEMLAHSADTVFKHQSQSLFVQRPHLKGRLMCESNTSFYQNSQKNAIGLLKKNDIFILLL